MIPNNNLNPLPWYTDLSDQNHRKEWAYGKAYPLISQSRLILPFQVIRPHLETSPITGFKLIELNTGIETDITADIKDANLVIKEFDDYDIILNYGRFLLPSGVGFKGLYYCEMTDGTNIWYSEVFNFLQDVSKYVKIVWYNRNDIFETADGHIDYFDGYQNFMYVASDIGKPDYPFEEEVKERDGHTFPEKQWSEKVYKFDIVAPEYLLDAWRIIRMHDYIFIEQGTKLWDVEQFLFDHEWEAQGDLAKVECEFHCDTVMKKIGKGIAALYNGDYNDDFNDDFSGGEGEGGEDVTHEFYTWTGEVSYTNGFLVNGCHFLVKVKATGTTIWDETLSYYQFRKTNWGAGIEYTIKVTRDGYNDLEFDFTAGSSNPQHMDILLIENPATIYYNLVTGCVDSGSAFIPAVTVRAKIEYNSTNQIDTVTGGDGKVTVQLKKGFGYIFTYSKTGYQTNSGLEFWENYEPKAMYAMLNTI